MKYSSFLTTAISGGRLVRDCIVRKYPGVTNSSGASPPITHISLNYSNLSTIKIINAKYVIKIISNVLPEGSNYLLKLN